MKKAIFVSYTLPDGKSKGHSIVGAKPFENYAKLIFRVVKNLKSYYSIEERDKLVIDNVVKL